MPRAKMTSRWVESVRVDPRRQIDYWDDKTPNFSLRVSPSGRKTWTVYYRYHKRKRRLTLGTFPAVPLADARTRARAALARVAAQQDPAAEKILAQRAGTFAELAREYMERHAKKKKKSWRNDQWMLNKHLSPRWRHVKVADITRPDVRALVEGIADRGAPVLANRVLALVSRMFSFAVGRDWRADNPSRDVTRPAAEHARDRVLSSEEIVQLWTALDADEPLFRVLFKLRFLTAARGGEIHRMRWNDVDFKTAWWTLPREFAKNGISQRVPLSPKAVELLKEWRTHQDERLIEINKGRAKKKWELREPSEWVFASPRGDGPFLWEQRDTKRLRERSQVNFRPHDIRRTVGTLLTKHCGVDRFILKRLLNHVDRDITGVYDRNRYDIQKRQALDNWGRVLQSILDGADVSDT